MGESAKRRSGLTAPGSNPGRFTFHQSPDCATLPKMSEAELWARYAIAAKTAGVPADQFKNFASAKIVLNPTQLRFSATARTADIKDGPIEIGFGGARGGGKSHGLIAQLGADDCQRFKGLKCLLLRKAAKSNIENFQDLRLKIFGRLKHAFVEKNKTLYFRNGSRIVLGHFQNERDIENYLGLEYDVIALEEATTLSPAKIKQIQTCCRTSKPGWRPRMYNNTNPGGVGHAFYRAKFILPYRAHKETTTRFIPSLPTDCPQNNEEYITVLDSLTGWQKKAWRFGDWDIAAGQFFTTFRNDLKENGGHIVEHFDPLKARQWFLSFDYGFKHYTAVYLGAECDDGLYIVDEYCERLRLPKQNADGIKEMIGRQSIGGINDKRKLEVRDLKSVVAGHDVFAKERDGKSVADDYHTHGIDLKPANIERINGWAEMMNLLGDPEAKPVPQPARMWIHRRCARLIECLPILEHDPNRPEDVLKVDCDDDGIGGDDPGDSLRYMVATKAKDTRTVKLTGH